MGQYKHAVRNYDSRNVELYTGMIVGAIDGNGVPSVYFRMDTGQCVTASGRLYWAARKVLYRSVTAIVMSATEDCSVRGPSHEVLNPWLLLAICTGDHYYSDDEEWVPWNDDAYDLKARLWKAWFLGPEMELRDPTLTGIWHGRINKA